MDSVDILLTRVWHQDMTGQEEEGDREGTKRENDDGDGRRRSR